MSNCTVCNNPTEHCIPSPIGPFSRWLCLECLQARRIPYAELVVGMSSRVAGISMFDQEFGTEYLDKFTKPTLEFFDITEEQMQTDAKRFWETEELPPKYQQLG